MFKKLVLTGLAALACLTFGVTSVSAQADSTDTAEPTIYLGVQGGPAFGDIGSSDGLVLTGDIAYKFATVPLWLEYEGGLVGEQGNDVSWSKIAYVFVDEYSYRAMAGVFRLGVSEVESVWGVWAAPMVDVAPGRSIRLSAELAFVGDDGDSTTSEYPAALKVGFFTDDIGGLFGGIF